MTLTDLFRSNISKSVAAIVLLLSTLYFNIAFNERAVIRATFVNKLAHGYMTNTYFLSEGKSSQTANVNEPDIDPKLFNELIHKFSLKGFTLKKISEATYVRDTSSNKLTAMFSTGYYNKLSGIRGSSVCVGPVTWISPFKAKVDVSWYFGMLSSARGSAIVTFGYLGWSVSDFETKTIS